DVLSNAYSLYLTPASTDLVIVCANFVDLKLALSESGESVTLQRNPFSDVPILFDEMLSLFRRSLAFAFLFPLRLSSWIVISGRSILTKEYPSGKSLISSSV